MKDREAWHAAVHRVTNNQIWLRDWTVIWQQQGAPCSKERLLISCLQSSSAVILEPKKINSLTVYTVSPTICHEVMGLDAIILLFECYVLSQLFHSHLLLSSRGSLVLLHFLPCRWCHLHIWGYWYFSWQSRFQLVLHPAWYFTWYTLYISKISRVAIYSLDILLSLFGTSLLFHVYF